MKKHKAFILPDSILGLFLALQACAILPLCIVPTINHLHEVRNQTYLKEALVQKLQNPKIQSLTLNSQKYVFRENPRKLQVVNLETQQKYNYQKK